MDKPEPRQAGTSAHAADDQLPSAQDEISQSNRDGIGSNPRGNLRPGDRPQEADHESNANADVALQAGANGTDECSTASRSRDRKPTKATGSQLGLGGNGAFPESPPSQGAPDGRTNPAVVVPHGTGGSSAAVLLIDGVNATAENPTPAPHGTPGEHVETTSIEAEPTTPTPILSDTPTPKALTEFRGHFFVIRGLRRV